MAIDYKKVFGNIEEEREYLRQFENTGGGEPIPVGEKWTTEHRVDNQGRDPKTGQFIDYESLGYQTKYEKRGKNNVPYIWRHLVQSFFNFDDPKKATNLSPEQLKSFIAKGTSFGTSDAQAVTLEDMTFGEFLNRCRDGSIVKYSGMRQGNYAPIKDDEETFRMGKRKYMFDSGDGKKTDMSNYNSDEKTPGKINSNGWNDNQYSDAERSNYYQKELNNYTISEEIENNIYDKLDEIFGNGDWMEDMDDKTVTKFQKRLYNPNIGGMLAQDFGRYDMTEDEISQNLTKKLFSGIFDDATVKNWVKNNSFKDAFEIPEKPTLDPKYSPHRFKNMTFNKKDWTELQGPTKDGSTLYDRTPKHQLSSKRRSMVEASPREANKIKHMLGDRVIPNSDKVLNERRFDNKKYEQLKKAGYDANRAKKVATNGRGNRHAIRFNRELAPFKEKKELRIANGMSRRDAQILYSREVKDFNNKRNLNRNYRKTIRKHQKR